MEGAEILLLDDLDKEVGPGEIGNITVKSRYLALGYWRRPELTDAVFSDAPEGDGTRVFRTGDLGRVTPDGLVEHLGRKDFQVKIRGHRVEIGEVERVLLELGNIKDVVVVLREDGAGEARLVAYVVPAVLPGPTIDKLRTALRGLVPEHVIPSVLVLMDALPLNLNGKVNRQALPDPNHSRPDLVAMYVAPRTATEASLGGIWAEVLGIERVGIHDDFFDLGGHSLAASRVISRVIEAFQLALPIKALFDAPTVAEMAAVITRNQATRAGDAELAQIRREVEAMTEEAVQRPPAQQQPGR